MAVSCALNPLDASINLTLRDQLTACTRSDGGFALMWSGIRGTVAITGGRFLFSVRLLRSLPVAGVPHPDGPDTEPAVRVGVSYPTADVGTLGEAPGSWAYSSVGSIAGAFRADTLRSALQTTASVVPVMFYNAD
jgi:hypothetical protein